MLRAIMLLLMVSCGIEHPAKAARPGDEYRLANQSLTSVEREMTADRERLARAVRLTVEGIVRRGIGELRHKGFAFEAYLAESEFVAMVGARDIGDHEPWKQWLADFYALLVDKLGLEIVEFLHLDDINVINYAVPVVFAPREFDADEYRLHFVPLAGVCAYWTTYGTCVAATWTAGAMFLICTPASMAAERVMVRRVAPGMSDRVHARRNDQWEH